MMLDLRISTSLNRLKPKALILEDMTDERLREMAKYYKATGNKLQLGKLRAEYKRRQDRGQ